MVSRKELNPHQYPESDEVKSNLNILLERINVIRGKWGKPMIITSGLRSQSDQERINPSAPKSKHLIGAAADIADKSGELYKWLKDNREIMSSAQLWGEEGTKGWVHLQIYPPKSGKRWFIA